MDFLVALLWFSPCLLPVAAVAALFLVALLRQAKQDTQRTLHKQKSTPPDPTDRHPTQPNP